MKRIPFIWISAVGCGLLLTISISSFSQKYGYKENAVPDPVNMSKRLQRLFAKTKLVCFGRYALELPIEGQLDWGSESTLEAYEGGMDDARQHAAGLIAKLKWVPNTRTVEVIYEGIGPSSDTWQIRYFESDTGKKMGMLFFRTYIVKGDSVFVTVDITGDGETEAQVAERQADLVKRIRLRADDEVPTEPGLCTESSFVAQATYNEQETVNAGIYLPSLPDVRFSVSSNKDAYADYSKELFEKIKPTELSLLGRIEGAKKDQPLTYPHRDVFREGKRDLHHWHGEESLYKRDNGMHDFEWALVGTPRDVANPSEFNVKMYTKVAHNTAGAAEEVSLTDDEAVALFDRLLSGLKFRVKVPGAPPGSYYFPEEKPAASKPR
jgi:hypothetical protein